MKMSTQIKSFLHNILPQGRGLKESKKINKLVHEYRHLIWNKYVQPKPENGVNRIPLIYPWERRKNQIETNLRDMDS